MPPIPSVWHWHSLVARHAKSLKAALQRARKAAEGQLTGKSEAQLEPILVRNTPKQPLHPLARIRQNQSRWFSTARGGVRHFTSASGRSARFDRASIPKSRIGSYITQSTGRAPFASTLRPNLTGGALGRTAGGYGMGSGKVGGARFFSHGPASQAQVVQNVSQAVRAFMIGGQKAQYNGVSPQGDKRYKAVSSLQEETGRKLSSLPSATPGSRLEFMINPTITAITPLHAVAGFSASEQVETDHLNTNGLMDVLSIDFSRQLKELAAVLNDLKRLSALGDLPITYEGSALRVHFPGCDSDTVERLCDELTISRGTVIQDHDFDAFAGTEIALLFPFAPSEEASEVESLFEEPMYDSWPKKKILSIGDMFTPSSPAYSTQSESGMEEVYLEDPLSPSPSGYESVRTSSSYGSNKHNPLEYQGFEGIYRFIEELDSVRR